MTKDRLKKMLADVAAGAVSVEEAFERLRALPYETVAGAHVDHHRGIRQGIPEVIFGEGKTAEQIVAIAGGNADHVLLEAVEQLQTPSQRRLIGDEVRPEAGDVFIHDLLEPQQSLLGRKIVGIDVRSGGGIL